MLPDVHMLFDCVSTHAAVPHAMPTGQGLNLMTESYTALIASCKQSLAGGPALSMLTLQSYPLLHSHC